MEILLELRRKNNKTQQDVANYLGISYQAYAHYEKGRNQPDPETIRKLALYFNVSSDYLLGLRDEIKDFEYSVYPALKDLPEDKRKKIMAEVMEFAKFLKSKHGKEE